MPEPPFSENVGFAWQRFPHLRNQIRLDLSRRLFLPMIRSLILSRHSRFRSHRLFLKLHYDYQYLTLNSCFLGSAKPRTSGYI